MLPLLLLAFIVVPIVELAVILQVGSYLGVGATIVLLVLDSIVGAVLVKREGRRAWDNFRTALAETRWPGDEVMQGALVLFGGALLLTPGFVTDVVGLLAVLPPTRAFISRVVRRRVTPAPIREVFDLRDATRGDRGETGRAQRRDRRAADHGDRRDVYDVEVVSVDREAASADGPGDDGSGGGRPADGGPAGGGGRGSAEPGETGEATRGELGSEGDDDGATGDAGRGGDVRPG